MSDNVRTLTTRHQQLLDAYKRMWESIPFDADGCKHAPVCNDEMPGYLGRLIGRTVTPCRGVGSGRGLSRRTPTVNQMPCAAARTSRDLKFGVRRLQI